MTSGSFNKYYQDELSYLREMGRDFSEAHPEAAPFLAEQGSDPDVERLLEGVAFLTGRIRQKLDDEMPEITHTLMQMLWPQYLRPLPAVSIVQFEPARKGGKGGGHIPRGTEIESIPVDGTPCRFRTVYDVTLPPVSLEGTDLKTSSPPHLRLRFTAGKGPLESLRMYLHGEAMVARALYVLLLHYTEQITVRSPDREMTLSPDHLRPVGFDRDEALFPSPPTSFDGFRLLHEYFAYPAKFLFVDLLGLEGTEGLSEITFELRDLPRDMPDLGTAGVLLGCTPVANVFEHGADPIRVDHERTEYKIRPSGSSPQHYEVFDVLDVRGSARGGGRPMRYRPFFGFQHSLGVAERDGAFFRSRLEPAVGAEGTDTYLTLVAGGEDAPPGQTETVTADLLCTNRHLPAKLGVGDIRVAATGTPGGSKFRNVAAVAPSVPPPLESDVYWRVLSHMALNWISLSSPEGLRGILALYNFRARVDRKAEKAHRLLLQGIQGVSTERATRLLKGTAIRGTAIHVDLDEDGFAGEGDLYLFATLLNEFLALYASINTFTRLHVRGTRLGEEYTWPARMSGQTIP